MKKRLIAGLVLFSMLCVLFTGCENVPVDNGTQNPGSGSSQDSQQGDEQNSQIDYEDKNGYLQDDNVFVEGVEKDIINRKTRKGIEQTAKPCCIACFSKTADIKVCR